MVDQVAIQIRRSTWNEGSAFAAEAYFRAGADADVPGTVHYRIDCLTTCRTVQDWTSIPTAAAVEIAISAANNAIQCDANDRETKQLTVVADKDAASQSVGVIRWTVENLKGL